MKKLLPLLLFSLMIISTVFSQNNRIPFNDMNVVKTKHTANINDRHATEVVSTANTTEHESVPIAENPFRTDKEVYAGSTIYDLQSNSSVCNRLTNHGDGTLSVVWTRGFEGTAFPDRGTGFNSFDGSEWGEDPSARLEVDARTGWPNYARTASGVDFICNHVFDAGAYRIHTLRRDNETDWIESDISTNTPQGVLWPRMVAGGADGNTLHVIGITPPTGDLGGTIYEGVDSHLLYFRSTDGGLTWDKQDVVIPGLDNTAFVRMSADSYAIDASGDVVSVAYFGLFNDIRVAKSTDNGENWSTQMAHDFPLDLYDIDDLYTVDQIPPIDTSIFDPSDSLAVFSSDGSGSVLVDNNGLVHITFGTIFAVDDADDGGMFSFFSTGDGMRYWNENFEQDSLLFVGDVLDYNGDGLNYPAGVVFNYGLSITTHPTMGVDANNNIYLAYSAVVENAGDLNDDGVEDFVDELSGFHYRHILSRRSTDSGETWSNPIDLITEATSIHDDLYTLTEAAYPHMAKLVDDKMHIVYQQDLLAGQSSATNTSGDAHELTDNYMTYLGVDLSDFIVVSSEEAINPESIGFTIAPNPANDVVRLAYELSETSHVNIHVQNIMGQHVRSFNLSAQQAGIYQKELNVADLAQGVYLIQIQANNQIATRKLIVE